ncbi:hypothetical protein LCGC14_0563390 [marine sediment metagenome]|uniref:Sjogrens syndrome scleroderma autoantigen 1 n=1 Tax=marine sediment metagenome TaxID=412755 RepID=A0A0F9U7T8_9ZZZZ|nr:MAG: hypothetical protein Lokiarch_50380 [Candidatus Lokiarchaeum sp. GC14_75]HEA70384.1 hypothetical protein [archaeon]
MADLLRSGFTMLNIACPECNNPIFRTKDNEKFCPSCNRKVLFVDKKSYNNKTKTNENVSRLSHISERNIDNNIIDSLEEILNAKIKWVAEKLQNETQLELIEKYTQILSNLYDLIIKLSSKSGQE